MGTRSAKVDAYIAKSADFAQPILVHLREIVHDTCPDVEEEMKWNFPHFTYKGMFASMAAFKEHCAFGFWKSEQVVGSDPKSKDAMGSFGRITSMKDLPPKKAIAGYVKTAMKLNDEGVKAIRRKMAKPKLETPRELVAALKSNKKAREHYEAFSPSHQREYAEWIAEAKGEDTRARRLETTLEWLAEGKTRHWKYKNC